MNEDDIVEILSLADRGQVVRCVCVAEGGYSLVCAVPTSGIWKTLTGE